MKLSKEELVMIVSSLSIATRSPGVQLRWIEGLVDLTIRMRAELELMEAAAGKRSREEIAMRVLEVYEANRENLDYISSVRQKYNTVNRNVMTRTIRKFCYDMNVAIEGDPEVPVDTPRQSEEEKDK